MRRGWRWGTGAGARTLAGFGLAVSLLSAQAAADAHSMTGADLVRIHADADWYRSRPEPERRWRGILKERPVIAGPGSRTALTFALVTAQSTYRVYAAGVDKRLAPFTGRCLEVEGKLVDLGDEGFGTELWIATARLVDGCGQ